MNKKIIGIILLVFFLGGGIFFWHFWQKKESLKSREVEFQVETVSTPEGRAKGLSERERICERCAMLFLFEKEGNYSFWMKGMRFDLDMIWIRSGRISGIKKNISYLSGGNYGREFLADSVLEVNAGTCDQRGIEVGDEVVSNGQSIVIRSLGDEGR